MLFKLGTGIFMATTVVFAGLYFAEREDTSAEVVTIVKEVKVEVPIHVGALAEVPLQPSLPKIREEAAPKIIIKKISSHPDLSEGEIDMMITLRNSMREQHSRHLKSQHPLLFERLEFDEETEKAFTLIVGERRMALGMRASDNLTEEEKAAFEQEKEDVLASIDTRIASVAGDQYETYIGYREKSKQYRSIAGLAKKLQTNGDAMSIGQQDQLAQVMFDNRREAYDDNKQYDWGQMHKTPEKAEEMVDFHRERYERMKEQVAFLPDSQRQAFEKQLDSHLSRYTAWAERIKNGKSGSQRRSGR